MAGGKGQPGVSSRDQTQWLGQESRLLGPREGSPHCGPRWTRALRPTQQALCPSLSLPISQLSSPRLQEMGGSPGGGGAVCRCGQPAFLPAQVFTEHLLGVRYAAAAGRSGRWPPLRAVLWG